MKNEIKNPFKSEGINRKKFLIGAAAVSTHAILGSPLIANSLPHNRLKKEKFDVDRFVSDCIEANKESNSQAAVKEVLQRAGASHGAVLKALGDPKQAGINVLHKSKTLTIFNATWTPQMNLMPHNHLMWANIGIYTGREDNILWKKSEKNIASTTAEALFEGDVGTLPIDAIHSVTNPLLRFTGGIHIYGGDFFNTTRSQWNPENLKEEPSNGAVIREMFRRENERIQKKKS